MPELKECVLFLEDTATLNANYLLEFDRNLNSLLQTMDLDQLKAIVIGRAETKGEMTDEKWKLLFKINEYLKRVPIIANANFGHTTPSFIFPIGAKCQIESSEDSKIRLILKNHK